MIEVRVATTPKDVQTCLSLRWTVFVEEQGVRPSDEQDAHDAKGAVHALALLDGVPCGAAGWARRCSRSWRRKRRDAVRPS